MVHCIESLGDVDEDDSSSGLGCELLVQQPQGCELLVQQSLGCELLVHEPLVCEFLVQQPLGCGSWVGGLGRVPQMVGLPAPPGFPQ